MASDWREPEPSFESRETGDTADPDDADGDGSLSAEECEAIRREHINTENLVRVVAALLILSSVVFALAAYGVVGQHFGYALAALAAGGEVAFGGAQLWRLLPLGRTHASVFAGVVVVLEVVVLNEILEGQRVPAWPTRVLLPLAIVTFAMILFWGRHGDTVFSKRYRTVVIPGSPDVRFNATPGMVLLLVAVGSTLVAAVVRAWMS
jgi:hypothetical protein